MEKRGGETLRNPIGKPSVGATLAVARWRGRTPAPTNRSVGADAPPLRTARYASVGAGVLDGPPIAPLAKNLVIAKPVRTPAVAIRTPVLSAPLPKGDWHGEAVTGGFHFAPHSL